MTLHRKRNSIEVQRGNRAVRQPRSPSTRRQSSPALVNPFHSQQKLLYVHSCIGDLCRKRDVMQLRRVGNAATRQ